MSSGDLSVFLHGARIGTLRRSGAKARFVFDEGIAATRAGSPLLSAALPVQSAPFDSAATESWFSGLLPEDRRLEEVRRFYGIEGSSYLDALAEVGWECAGAVSILPYGEETPAQPGAAEKLTMAELSQRLAALPSHPFDAASTMRVSLGGFQEKLCVRAAKKATKAGRVRLRNIELPLDGAPTTHILKPQPARFPGTAEAEAWAMTAAAYATPAAKAALLDGLSADTPPTLVVARFDRVTLEDEDRVSGGTKCEGAGDGEPRRIHQEDCCQAMGIPTERKYAAESTPKKSDPTFEKIAHLLMLYAVDAHGELLALLRQMTVNVVVGNTDAHAKNYALLHFGDTISLAPMYDIVPAREITPGITAMGMRIDGRIRIDRIGREQIIAEAAGWGLSRKECAEALDEALENLSEGVSQASDIYPEAGERHAQPTMERIAKLMR